MPTLPDADVGEPLPAERRDDDLVGVPAEDDPAPSDVQPGGADSIAGGGP